MTNDSLTAHMFQQLLLALVAPPLLLLSVRPAVVERLLERGPVFRKAEHILGRPMLAWLSATTTLYLWHVPSLSRLAMTNSGVRLAQLMMMVITATMFWWPVVSPLPEKRLSPPIAVLYLFSACAASSVLGIIMTMIPAEPSASPLAMYRSDDREIAGLLMWVGCCLVYLSAIVLTLARWYGAADTDAQRGRPARPITLGRMEHS